MEFRLIPSGPGAQAPGPQDVAHDPEATSYKLQAPSATKRTQLKSIINLERNKL